MEIENHHFTITTIITVIGKNHWWMLTFMGKSMIRGYLRSPILSLQKTFINYKRKKIVTIQWRKLSDITINKGLKLASWDMRHSHSVHCLTWSTEKRISPLLPKMHNHSIISRKYWAGSTEGHSTKSTQYSWKGQGNKRKSFRLEKIKQTRQLNVVWNSGLDVAAAKKN